MASNLNLNQPGTGAGAGAGSSVSGLGSMTRSATSRLALLFTPPSSSWASADLKAYQARYPGQRQNVHANKNLDFYCGRIPSAPRPAGLIDAIHISWRGDYDLLEVHHGYIQWLFPIREDGLNSQAQMLYLHEIKGLVADAAARQRLIVSYRLMLDFYGMELADESLGLVVRGKNYETRYAHLNRSMHNYLRITRILKCLGELGREEMKLGFLLHIVKELVGGQLKHGSVGKSAVNYWFPCLRDPADRARLQTVIDELKKAETQVGSSVALTDARIRTVLEEARAARAPAVATVAAAAAGDASAAAAASSSSAAAAAAAAAPHQGVVSDDDEIEAAEDGEQAFDDIEDEEDGGEDGEDSPRADAEAMAPSRGASSSEQEPDAAGRTVAAAASPSSATAAAAPSSAGGKRKAESDDMDGDSPRARKIPTPTNSGSKK